MMRTADQHRARPRSARPRRLLAVLTAVATTLLVAGGPLPAGADTSFTFHGGGWGSGVGMGQYGACSMAAGGHNASQILTHYYRGTAVTPTADVTDLRVLLRVASAFTLTTGGTTTFAGVGSVPAGSVVTVGRSGNHIVLSGAITGSVANALVVHNGGSPLRISPPGNRFNRGTVVFRLDAGGGLRAIVQGLTSNAYARGLGEMPSSWPAEALKAQAIAARTIAKKQATRPGRWSADHDLSALIDGAYIGYDQEFGAMGARWNAAVDATNGLVLTYNGALTHPVYSSSTGGHTEHSEHVWTAAVPYLRGVPDPHDSGCNNKRHQWTMTFSGTQLGQKLGMGPITNVSVGGGAGVSGRLDKVKLTFTDARGSRQAFTGIQLRSSLGLYSTRFTVAGATSPGGSSPGSGTRATGALIDIRVHDGRNLLVAGKVRDPDGAPRVVVATAHNGRTDLRIVPTKNGYFLDVWPVQPGEHTTCIAVLDHPTDAAYSLGCRKNTVK